MYRHGLADKIPEYYIWSSMRRRCYYPRDISYKYYGARGIKVCERWNDFSNFLTDMGYRPTPKHRIERINNDGDYEPANCRWATPKEQAHNRRSGVHLISGERSTTAKLTNEQAAYIRRLHLKGGYTNSLLGKMFGVSPTSISNILNNKSYRGIKTT